MKEVDYDKMEKLLEECGWAYQGNGMWQDPLEANTRIHIPTSMAYHTAKGRIKDHQMKRQPRLSRLFTSREYLRMVENGQSVDQLCRNLRMVCERKIDDRKVTLLDHVVISKLCRKSAEMIKFLYNRLQEVEADNRELEARIQAINPLVTNWTPQGNLIKRKVNHL